MKRKILIFFVSIIALNVWANETKEIPFHTDADGYIYISVSDKNNTHYDFMIDSGSTYNVLFTKGYEKIKQGLDYDFDEAMLTMIKEYNPEFTDSQAAQLMQEYIESNYLEFSLSDLTVANQAQSPKNFIYNLQAYKDFDKTDCDGIVGLSFFDAYYTITFDYINSKIVMDDEILNAAPVPMKILPMTRLYTIEIKIDNVPQEALIDTGCNHFFLRPEYKSKKVYTEGELLNVSGNELPKYKNNKITEQKVTLCIGDFKKKVIGYFPDKDKYSHTKEGESFAARINLLGNQIYMNHKIQLDFVNMEFRIE